MCHCCISLSISTWYESQTYRNQRTGQESAPAAPSFPLLCFPRNTQLRLYSRWRQLSLSHQLPVPLVSPPPPPFSLSPLTPSCTTWFSVPCLKTHKAVSFPPAFETLKSADFCSLIHSPLIRLPQHFPYVAVLPNLTSVFISPSSAGT